VAHLGASTSYTTPGRASSKLEQHTAGGVDTPPTEDAETVEVESRRSGGYGRLETELVKGGKGIIIMVLERVKHDRGGVHDRQANEQTKVVP